MRFRNRFVLCIVPLAFALTGCFQQAGTALQEPIVTNQAVNNPPATTIPLPTQGDRGTDNPVNPGTLNTPTLGTVPDSSNTSTDNGNNPPVALTIISATIPPLATDTPSSLVDAGGQTDQTGQGTDIQGTPTDGQFITPSGPLGPVTQVPVQAATNNAQPTSTPSGLITPTAFSNVESSGDGCSHTVQSGDTLYRIAVKYGITVAQLQQANQQVTGTIIQPGDVLKIPGCNGSGSTTTTDNTVTQPTSTSSAPATALPSGSQTYVVKRGDTLYTIGLKFGVTADAIQKANNISNPNRIDPGQELVIPPKSG
jgi:LysM repeat protein